MICEHCKTDFEAKRADARYCSAKCRVTANRVADKCNTVTDNKCNKPAVVTDKPANYGLEDCQCMHCTSARANKSKNTINHGPYKQFGRLEAKEVNRVALPGDIDYAA